MATKHVALSKAAAVYYRIDLVDQWEHLCNGDALLAGQVIRVWLLGRREGLEVCLGWSLWMAKLRLIFVSYDGKWNFSRSTEVFEAKILMLVQRWGSDGCCSQLSG